jgi:peroxiredoxin
MQAYRDRYAEIQKQHGRVLAVSADDVETLKRWREELKAPQTFIADPEGKLIRLYDTKMPVVGIASRRTFVIGAGRKVLEVQEGNEAIDPAKSVRACGLHKPAAAAPPPASMPDAGAAK